MKIIAHRGASARAPENTLAAVRLAVELGADGVEVDVHLTKDGRLAVLHDPDTRRTAPGQPGRAAASSTLAELQTLDAGAWKDPRFKGERIPALEDVLAAVPAPREIFIEMKSGQTAGLLAALDKALGWEEPADGLPPQPSGKSWPPERFVVMSFQEALVREIKRRRPPWRVLLLVDKQPPTAWPAAFLADIRARRLDGLGQNRAWALAATDYAALHAAGAILSVWTVNDPAEAGFWRERDFDYLTTDVPERMKL